MLRITNKFRVSLLLILLIIFNSIYIDAAPTTSIGDNGNIAPTIDLNVTPAKKPVDIVILTDYTGTKLTALNTQINALKAQLSAVNVDPVFHVINDVKSIGTQQDEIYKFRRYAHYNYQVHYYSRYTPASSWNYYYNYWLEERLLWEETQGLASQAYNLPVRNPQNITFTRSSLKIYDTSAVYKKYYDVTIKCTNDVKTSGMVQNVQYYDNSDSGYAYNYDYMISENVTIDTNWTREYKISDVTYNIYSLSFDKLSTLSLRTGSDRHMIFLSDAYAKDYSKTLGSYFSFGGLNDAVNTYIKSNNFKVYGVMPEKSRDMTLLPEKVSNIVPLGDTTLFYMQNGELWKLGDPVFASEASSGTKLFPELLSDIGSVKDTVSIDNYYTFMLMDDGTIKYFDSTTNKIATLSGISDITALYKFPSRIEVYCLNSSGKIFTIDYHLNIISYNNSVAISHITSLSYYMLFITSTGVPYMEYTLHNNYTGVGTSHLLTRAKIRAGDGTLRYLPNVKDASYFNARAPKNSLSPILVLYTTGQIQQFTGYAYETVTSSYYEYNYTYLQESAAYSILETNVNKIESNDICIFIYKTDGAVKMLNTDWIDAYYKDDDGDRVYYKRPVFVNTTRNVPLTNIKKTFVSGYHKYFFMDANNRTYMYDGTRYAPEPVLGTNLIDMGTDINKIAANTASKELYIIYNDNTVRQIKYNYSDYSYNQWSNAMLPYNNIKDIYASLKGHVYLLTTDGGVLGKGTSIYGQLGIIGTSYSSFVDPFISTLSFDKTIYHYSILDIFNGIAANEFYSTGQYTAAFNSIYNNYSSYSGTGNMYVLLGEDIQYKSTYSDYEHDPEYSRKWRISHDPFYFDNSMGLSIYHNPSGFTANPPVKLDKPGKYIINLKARDNPKNDSRFDNYRLWSLGDQNLTVYVHRKPIALQKITITNNGNGTFTVKALDAGSYDPDHSNSRSDKGIIAREWRWRESASTVWTAGQMNKTDCTAGKSYITQLRVKDAEGVWSDYATITIDKNNPPVALFSLDKTIIKNTEYLKVKDQSYPQSFSSIIKWHWIVKKYNSDGTLPSSNIQNAQFPDSNTGTGSLAGYDKNVKYSYTGTGKYKVYLRVKDSNGLWSDGGTDSAPDLSSFCSQDIEVDSPPAASFVIEKNPIFAEETLMLKDQSAATGTSPLMKWHWVVKKLNQDGSVPGENIQDEKFTDSNTGTGETEGYDVNVKTLYADKGPGTYRIYLRVMNGNNMWSDGGTESAYNLNGFFYRDLVVRESFKMSNFRVVKIRDLHLEPYYYNNGVYIDRPFYVDSMAIDTSNFIVGGISIVPGFGSLTKGYSFEFEIDTANFNEADDTIVIIPRFFSYTEGVPAVRGPEADLYWEDSDKNIYKAGEGGHSSWAAVTLDNSDRTVTGADSATWRGEYFIPATSWLVPLGTAAANAKSSGINADIIVNFSIKGYKNGVLKYDYNLRQWPVERTIIKHPYEIGDVIRYDHTKSSLDDTYNIINRP